MDTTLSIEWVERSTLFCSPANPRHNDEGVPQLAASIRRFGWQQPIVAKRSGEVIAGNTRLKAATELGHERVPVVWFEGTDLEATAYQIADNKLHELSSWNDAALAEILKQLRAEDALDGVGYSSADIDELLQQLGDLDGGHGGPVEDPGPEDPPKVAVTRPGDRWILGDHVLMCGDSTRAEDVDRLMAGEKAALVATDPPFLISYTGDRPNDAGKDWSDVYREVDIKDADAFFRGLFTNVLRVLAPGGAVYAWHAHKRCGEIQRIWQDLGILDHQQIIWVKPTSVFGRVYWHFRHEPCMMGWRKGDKPAHDGVHEHDSVWEVDWEGKQRVVGNEHPTQKPVELFARPMRKHTRRGDVVFEPFSGSGSQLIAAEQQGRRCRAMEIEPVFCDVGLKRWQTATSRQAVLDGDGRTFAEVGAERLGKDFAVGGGP